jgi:hypothetical protein
MSHSPLLLLMLFDMITTTIVGPSVTYTKHTFPLRTCEPYI